MKTNLFLRISLVTLSTLFAGQVFAETNVCTIKSAAIAATALLKSELSPENANNKIVFQKSNSYESTAASMRQNMKYFSAGTNEYRAYEDAAQKLEADPTLHTYTIFLGMGSGDEATQNIYKVKMREVGTTCQVAEIKSNK